jgi:DnaJ-class molecular chaperone
MSLPDFSASEVDAILLAARKVCRTCNGTGKVREEIATAFTLKNYPNGSATFIIRCHMCGGFGMVDPNQVADEKTAAAGGDR